MLPIAAVVDEKIFCIHAGLSPDLNTPEQIKRITRPTDVPDTGLLCDLLWSDPDKDVTGWGDNDRGVSFTFGADVVSKFLDEHDLDLVCRAHQVMAAAALLAALAAGGGRLAHLATAQPARRANWRHGQPFGVTISVEDGRPRAMRLHGACARGSGRVQRRARRDGDEQHEEAHDDSLHTARGSRQPCALSLRRYRFNSYSFRHRAG